MTGKQKQALLKRVQASLKIVSMNLSLIDSDDVLLFIEKNTNQVRNYVLNNLVEPEEEEQS